MFRIEVEGNGVGGVLRLIGRVRHEHLEALAEKLAELGGRRSLDLNEVTLVDLQVVQFLAACEKEGIELKHCPPYVREWITGEMNNPTR
jgi:STAS domain